VVFNLFCSIAPLQELCFKIAPTYDFSVGKNITLIWKYFNADEIKGQFSQYKKQTNKTKAIAFVETTQFISKNQLLSASSLKQVANWLGKSYGVSTGLIHVKTIAVFITHVQYLVGTCSATILA